jgi:hypothetical protein
VFATLVDQQVSSFSYMFYMVTEVPVLEDTITRVMVMGLSRGDRLHADCMDIVDNLVRRAAQLHLKGNLSGHGAFVMSEMSLC